MTEMKILLIDLQDNDNKHTFANKENLRKWLIGFHSIDYETQEGDRDINELTLQELCEHGEWDYKILDKKRELKKRGVTNGGQQMNNQKGGRFKYWKEGVKGFCIGFFGLFAITALAGSGGAIVTDHYHNVEYSEPYSVKVCRNEAVASGNAVNDAIWGGIFGAVIGDAIDDEDGKVPGAIIGALIGANNGNNATMTPAAVCRTETRYHTIQRGEYSHSTIEFDYEGARYRLNFTKR